VMGSKGVKAIVLEPGRGTQNAPKDPAGYKEDLKQFSQLVLAHPATRGFRDYGTVRSIDSTSVLAVCPAAISAAVRCPVWRGFWEEASATPSRPGEGRFHHPCLHAGCLVQCSNIFPDREGKAIVAPIEYESLAMLGPNLGITDLDAIAGLNYLANDVGVDTMEVGAALGWPWRRGD